MDSTLMFIAQESVKWLNSSRDEEATRICVYKIWHRIHYGRNVRNLSMSVQLNSRLSSGIYQERHVNTTHSLVRKPGGYLPDSILFPSRQPWKVNISRCHSGQISRETLAKGINNSLIRSNNNLLMVFRPWTCFHPRNKNKPHRRL